MSGYVSVQSLRERLVADGLASSTAAADRDVRYGAVMVDDRVVWDPWAACPAGARVTMHKSASYGRKQR